MPLTSHSKSGLNASIAYFMSMRRCSIQTCSSSAVESPAALTSGESISPLRPKLYPLACVIKQESSVRQWQSPGRFLHKFEVLPVSAKNTNHKKIGRAHV